MKLGSEVLTNKDTPCWSCRFQKIGGYTFLGQCRKPARNNPTGEKEIPPEIVDKGCRFWEERIKDEMP